MTISSYIFEAFFKCPMKCWLRATNERPTGNAYAEWLQTESDSYGIAGSPQLIAKVTVAAGQSVTWTNAEDSPHQVAIAGKSTRTGVMLKGQRASRYHWASDTAHTALRTVYEVPGTWFLWFRMKG